MAAARYGLLGVVGCVVLALTACGAATNNPKPPASPLEPEPAASSPAAVATTPAVTTANLTLKASQFLTHGSTGTPAADLKVTVTNHGPGAPPLILKFTDVPIGVTLEGSVWSACDATDNGVTRTVACPVSSVAIGASADYAFTFRIDFAKAHGQTVGTVTVDAVGTTDGDPTDNSADLVVCTNGCVS